MSSIAKLLARMRRSPRQVRYEELLRVLRHYGWRVVNVTGSHQRFEPASGDAFVLVVRPHGTHTHCHPRDVADVLSVLPEGEDSDRPEM